jgi:hypothetical protein
VQDSGGSAPVNVGVTVVPAPLLASNITVTGNLTPGCDTTENTCCSGAPAPRA